MRRAVGALLGLGLLTAGGVTLLAGQAALRAADDLERARGTLRSVTQGDADSATAVAALDGAQADVRLAADELERWPVDVLAAVPVLGRSWDAERAVARTAGASLAAAQVLADGLDDLRSAGSRIDVAALARTADALAKPVAAAERALDDLSEVSTSLTPPQVSDGVAQARAAFVPAVAGLERARAGMSVAPGLLGGARPRSVLVMLQNNAELRGAGGYSASFATGRLEDGALTLGPLQDTVAEADPPSRAREVPAPPEYLEDYGPLAANTTGWRSWNMSPHVPDSALVGARIAGQLLPQQPDLVVLLDVPAMGALASLGGGDIVLPGGRRVTPAQLTDALLVDAYALAGEEVEEQLQRRADLQLAASAAVGRLLASPVPATELARALGRLTAGRHLTMWSADPAEQQALVELDVAGSVPAPSGRGDLSHVSVNNVGANKLDIYVDREIAVEAVVDHDVALVVQRVRLTNRAPEDLVPYVAGFDRPGVVVSRVELSVPAGATGVVAEVDDRPWTGTVRPGAERQRLATRVELARGASTLLEVRYSVPVEDGEYALRLVPQPLVEDATLSVVVRAAGDRRLVDPLGGVGGDGALRQDGPLATTREVRVLVQDLSLWQRLVDFWSSPVTLG